jgi:hypothetical protein
MRLQMVGMESRRWLDMRLDMLNGLIQPFTALFCILAQAPPPFRWHFLPLVAELWIWQSRGPAAERLGERFGW